MPESEREREERKSERERERERSGGVPTELPVVFTTEALGERGVGSVLKRLPRFFACAPPHSINEIIVIECMN
jgi:hypothetical protein